MQNIEINYGEVVYHIICQREHLVRDIYYQLYIFKNAITLSTEIESPTPKYMVPINLENNIHWVKNNSRVLTQFGIEYKGTVKYFTAPEQELKIFKRIVKNKIMYREVSDFYQPLKLLGKGGSSKVYLVHDKDNSAEFASKCIEKRYLREDGGYIALFNEISIMGNLDHEQIVKLEEVYEGDNTFYLILEYLKGPSLHDLCNSRSTTQPLTWEQIKQIMWQILKGVAHMHSLNIMHRDLKPENIMFKEHGSVQGLRIVDFGLATNMSVDKYPFPKCGTPGYVAPEIANLKDLTLKYDKICDMFSVGCIFYKLITSKDLFPGTDYHEILKLNKKCNVNLDYLQIFKAPSSAVELISSMLNPNPSFRISAAKALEHLFFVQSPQNDIRINFQQKKRLDPSNKLWQTQLFKNLKSDKIQLPEIPLKLRQQVREDEVVEDEKVCINVPVMKSPRFQQQIKQKNINLIDNQPSTPRTKQIKKYSTQEYDLSSDASSPDSGRMRPTIVLKNSTHSSAKAQTPRARPNKQIIFQRQMSNQPIEEVNEEETKA
ncbi:unnamed protein product [Paramecium sonneborni]|uniref:Protein kinase domain-containing protein n=1 Tax=Paramecium sonneborni TaxID=65129 RepID=A0A8S1QV30_9CILI|nr:unnamed protein product [Paramecium sonneborni]